MHLLEMLGKEEEIEQGRLVSEVNGCVQERPMVRPTVSPAESRDIEKGIAVVDGIVILHKMKSNTLQTVVDLSHRCNELLLSMATILKSKMVSSFTIKTFFLINHYFARPQH